MTEDLFRTRTGVRDPIRLRQAQTVLGLCWTRSRRHRCHTPDRHPVGAVTVT
jgi:hypothetical protein